MVTKAVIFLFVALLYIFRCSVLFVFFVCFSAPCCNYISRSRLIGRIYGFVFCGLPMNLYPWIVLGKNHNIALKDLYIFQCVPAFCWIVTFITYIFSNGVCYFIMPKRSNFSWISSFHILHFIVLWNMNTLDVMVYLWCIKQV